MGYWLGQPYWSSGYMTEAIRGVLPFAFQNPDVLRVIAYTNPVNEASQNVLRKSGLRYLGITPREKPNRLRGSAEVTYWEVLREDFNKTIRP
jgi:RimJ/RimL family protein N-acetyltransferase